MSDIVKVLLLILLLSLVLVFAPLLTIWSLNTLFALTIAYSVKTWFAIVWLTSVTFGGVQAAVKAKN